MQDAHSFVEDEWCVIFRRRVLERAGVVSRMVPGDFVASFNGINKHFIFSSSGVAQKITHGVVFVQDWFLRSALGDQLLQYSCPQLQENMACQQ